MKWIKIKYVYGRFDSKIRFEIESDGRFDSRFDSNAKRRFAAPYIWGKRLKRGDVDGTVRARCLR